MSLLVFAAFFGRTQQIMHKTPRVDKKVFCQGIFNPLECHQLRIDSSDVSTSVLTITNILLVEKLRFQYFQAQLTLDIFGYSF